MPDVQASGWEDILSNEERVVWQDQPDARLRLRVRDPMEFGLGFALTFGPITPGLLLFLGGDPLWWAGIPAVLLGLWFLVGWCLWDTFLRQRTWYSLSTRRAFLATALPGRRRLTHTPLAPGTAIARDRLSPDSVSFVTEGHPKLVFRDLKDAGTVVDLAERLRAGWRA